MPAVRAAAAGAVLGAAAAALPAAAGPGALADAPAQPRAAAVPVAADAHRVAVKISSWGPRPAGSEREARAHSLIARVFRRAELRVGTQVFRVPGHGRSRNVIGVFDTPRTCLRIVMAHGDSTPDAPGANDNGSGLGVVASLAGRLRLIEPWCDVWLVATGAEERVYTGSPEHLGALALAKRARAWCPRAASMGAFTRRGRPRLSVLAALARELRAPASGGRPPCRRCARGHGGQLGTRRGQRQLRPPRVPAARASSRQAWRRRAR